MLPWALLGLTLFFLLVTYIVVQGSRAAMAWRKSAAEGDVKVIRLIVDDSLSTWRSMKRPKQIPPDVWRGIQSMQLTDLAGDFVRVSCQAQSEYRMAEGRWVEVQNPFQEGIEITARAADMLLYEMPHYRPDRVQIDVYTAFREGDGLTRNICILTTGVTREQAREVDWEEWTAEEIVSALGGRYRLGEFGQPLPIEVDAPSGALEEIPVETKVGRRR
jgi:hypothetical protein